MKQTDIILLLAVGLFIWIAGTVYYGWRGPAILETSPARYWTAFAISPVISGLLCIAILMGRHIAPQHWAAAMLLLSIPGMVGEAVVLSHLGIFMPRLHAQTGGRYGAFLFATYGLVLAIGEIVTLRATP
jgi:hypothetical protein